ncbi:disease resistance protein At4g27190-like [Populus alba]|uniref:disease resistance protein At4g27190-like n=1 Tax=Populus alba TaxID=43335 RepID=UPI003CC766CB
MLRQNDPVLHHDDRSFWEYVEKMDDGRMRCKFCGQFFAERTSITRIKHHLSGRKRGGAQNCAQVPQHVRDAALAAIDGPPAKKRKTVAGSSNNEVTNAISASAQQQNNEMMMSHQREDLSLEDWMASITAEDMELLEGGSFHERPSFNQADEPRGDPSQTTNDQLCSPSVNNDVIVNDTQNVVGVQGMEQVGEEERFCSHLDMDNSMENTGEGSVQHVDRIVSPWRHAIDENYSRRGATDRLVQPGVGASSCGGNVNHNAISTSPQGQNNEVDNLTGDATFLIKDDGIAGVAQPGAGTRSSEAPTRGTPLPTGSTKLVGRAFEENKNVICSWLMDDEVSTISIYGMGGAGKTTMLKHIHNELLQNAKISHYMYWVTVSRDFSIYRLQNLIAKCLALNLSNEDDDLIRRAIKLSQELMKKQRWILILDDLWNSFELHEVGIPVTLKGCKLIMTTRSIEVWRQMNCRNNVRVNPLSDGEAWTLFMEILGHDTRLPSEVEQIAKSITRECDGLPLGIKTIAGTMKGVDDIHEWSSALEDLRQSRVTQDKVEKEVFQILRFSYTHLSSALQQCFLYCGLFPEDFVIPRENLIDYLIDEGVVKGQKSREAEIHKGHTMLNRLQNVCLLESVISGNSVKMHDLIRDMAIQILQENCQAIVQAGAQLEELPDAEEWTEKLTTVSLMHNQIQEICSSHSVRCPNLSTLLLCDNHRLRFIADSFFEQMHGLKVLNLSGTSIECLSNSISDLVGLTSLLLKDCRRLSHVPSLKKLRALKRLVLSNTPLEKIPHGIECLSNLRYLRMNGCGEKNFPGGILPKLSHLQVLILEEQIIDGSKIGGERYAPVTVEGKEIGCLRKLERLECHFENHSNYMEYLNSRVYPPRRFKIAVSTVDALVLRKCSSISSGLSVIGKI